MHALARHRPLRRQRGAALLTAMIIVTLVATLAAAMVWQQWRSVQVEAAERARVQAAWILSGALDFARLILKETVKVGKPTTLDDPWATPLAESRLSTFLAVDKSNAADGPEAFLSGDISDAQARYNLANLVDIQNEIIPSERETLVQLCHTASIDGSVAQRIATGWRDAKRGSPASPLLPQAVAQLTWLGIDQASVSALEPYVVVLPSPTAINVNTASSEVVAAVLGVDAGTAAHLVQMRQRKPFKTRAEVIDEAKLPLTTTAKFGADSSSFEVHTRLRLVDRVLIERSVLRRSPIQPSKYDLVYRERVSGLEQLDGAK